MMNVSQIASYYIQIDLVNHVTNFSAILHLRLQYYCDIQN